MKMMTMDVMRLITVIKRTTVGFKVNFSNEDEDDTESKICLNINEKEQRSPQLLEEQKTTNCLDT